MRKLTRVLKGIGGSIMLAALLLCFSASAFAAGPQVNANIQAGSTLSATASDASISSFTLDGTSKYATYTLPITIVDARGSGAGWSLTMTSTTFSTSDNSHSLANDASTISSIALAASSGSSLPVASGQSIVTAIPAGATAPDPVKIFSAATNSGMGTTTVTPTVQISVPASTYAGTYTSTLTIGINSAP